jgi:hypothetical protein
MNYTLLLLLPLLQLLALLLFAHKSHKNFSYLNLSSVVFIDIDSVFGMKRGDVVNKRRKESPLKENKRVDS